MEVEYRYTFAAWAEVFTIFAKYGGNNQAELFFEYDRIWACPDDCSSISEEDHSRLLELSWHKDERYGEGYNRFYNG